MKKRNHTEIVYIIFVLLIFVLAIFSYFLFSGDNGYKYANKALNIIDILLLFAIFVLLPMVYFKANKASGGRLTPSRFIKEILKINQGTSEEKYNEKDAQNYVYSRLDKDFKNKFTDSEVNKILEYISYFINEKNINENDLYKSLKDEFSNLTENELDIIRKFESEYCKHIKVD